MHVMCSTRASSGCASPRPELREYERHWRWLLHVGIAATITSRKLKTTLGLGEECEELEVDKLALPMGGGVM